MKLRKIKRLYCGVLLCSVCFIAHAAPKAAVTPVPALTAPVVDTAHIMQDEKKQALNSYLSAVSEQTGVQIAVLTVPSLGGETIESYSMRVAESWKLGDAKKDSGALLVVAVQEHSLRIETGYGLEGLLTDAVCGMIIRNSIVPQFKAGNYTQGIVNGALKIAAVATEGAEITTVARPTEKADRYSAVTDIGAVVFCLLIVFMVLSSRSGLGMLWWPSLFAGSPYRRRRTFWRGGMGGGDFYGGSHFDSSHFGGGFGGGPGSHFSGGGGHFGGGGASGK